MFFAVAGCAARGAAPEGALQAHTSDLWEMTIMAGRYGVMLAQAREILGLPEPPPAGENPLASERRGERRERRALARYQAALAKELFADAARAYAAARTPPTVRALACRHRSGMPTPLHKEPKRDLQSLSARNDALGRLIMPWWDAACALAPKPGEGEDPVCVME